MYKPVLLVPVEALGATFMFGAADESAQAFEAAVSEVALRIAAPLAEGGSVEMDVDDMPAELTAVFARYFVEGVKEWQGVVQDGDDPDGPPVPIPCTPEARAAIPTGHKVVVVSEYLRTLTGISKKRGLPNEQPMSSTPPGE